MVLSSAPLLRSDVVIVESLTGARTEGSWAGIAENGDVLVQAQGAPTAFAPDTLREIRFANRESPTSRPAALGTLEFADGGRLAFTQLRGAAADAIAADTLLAGELVIPFRHLAAVRFDKLSSDAGALQSYETEFADRKPGKDVLISGAGGEVRSVRGTLVSLDAEAGRFDFAGDVRTFKVADTLAIVLASGAGSTGRPPAELRLVNGGRVGGRLVHSTGSAVSIETSFGALVDVPLERIESIGLSSDRIVMLSDLTAATTTVEGLLHEPWPVRTGRNVANGPIVLGGVEYARGVGVHSRTELVYELDGSFAQFISTIGIDDAVRPLGSVEFKVLGDGETLYQSGPLTGNDAPRPIDVPISGVKRLTLLVDYGGQLDLADHADWADARLVRPPAARR